MTLTAKSLTTQTGPYYGPYGGRFVPEILMPTLAGEIELFEFCFYRVMMSNLGRAIDPTGKHGARRSKRRDLQSAALELLRVLAEDGMLRPRYVLIEPDGLFIGISAAKDKALNSA